MYSRKSRSWIINREEIRHDAKDTSSLGNIFTKNLVALVSLGINYCRNLTNNKCVEIIGSHKKEIYSIP